MKRSRIKKFIAEFVVRELAHRVIRALPPAGAGLSTANK
jgi:hypothetical protein